MQYQNSYHSPVGEILLTADDTALTGLWFKGGKYDANHPGQEQEEKRTPALAQAREWLTIYFSGRQPHFRPPIHISGTSFQLAVWNILQNIPYGETVTYGEIAKEIAAQRGLSRMSAQAVGGAVGHNPLSIIIPCHRVVGADGSLTGYSGGIEKKVKLLALEKVDLRNFYLPV